MSVLSMLRRGAAAGVVVLVLGACGDDGGGEIRELPGEESDSGSDSDSESNSGTGADGDS